ncbi:MULTISPECIES: ABC transporter permease [Lactobacillales]|uniref:ABC transporter permease n=3 Tax=Aerococcus TaxID=1375 RepID=A0A7W2FI30_9LACT|nr:MULTISPECIES: ABC transporter permease [Lactobacillales]KAF3301900.1 ABC transporter permease subunit [Carnobacterium sp. PL17RED31]AMC00366.1 amino acid ABC transporter permease [Aerococcus viridans]EFG49836.1 ABC transporter, permease protein [Aerococcus viridans ATCC 11563 = CCUG 4311]KAF3298683.1 ABC transporter permease subunit [Carnobacterium sp. PL26RED25]KAF3301833.1 ABC transporter permease subunit [Carnobacterium sp. PL12RED10]
MVDVTQLDLFEQIVYYFQQNGMYLLSQFFRQLLMTSYGVVFAIIVAVPLGFFIAHKRKTSSFILGLANIIQTVPNLALLSVVMLVMGLGPNLVVFTIFLYSILPILRNTYTGVISVDDTMVDVGKGMGMTPWQVIYKVELPLALSVIMGGIRNAFITGIGISTIGTFVGAGGLGDVLQRGVNASDGTSIIIAAVIPISLMSILADWLLGLIEKRLDPSSTK